MGVGEGAGLRRVGSPLKPGVWKCVSEEKTEP